MKRVVVDNNYTYETNLKVKVGDTVKVPTTYWLRDVFGAYWFPKVTNLKSDYTGDCLKIVEVINTR